MRRVSAIIGLAAVTALAAHGQVLLSKGTSYTQNFDALASSGSSAPWTDNVTLPGWYAASQAMGNYGSCRVGGGENKNTGLYSFGTNGAGRISDRALGSIASTNPAVIAFGVRFKNDTARAMGDIMVSYTGEQWRNSTRNSSEQALAFWYRTSATPITNPEPGVTTNGWTAVTALDFTRLKCGGETGALDGNDSENRTKFSKVPLARLSLKPGHELFLRWVDVDDLGQSDHGLAVDDLTVSFAPAGPNSGAASQP